MKLRIKYILLCAIMGSLFLPLLQENFHLSPTVPLAGDYVPASNVVISRHTWFNKEFQEKKEKFLQDHFGYHNTYIRIHNQIAFYLFKKAKANGVVIGKENYLYEARYIDAYYGTDFIGQDSIRKKMFMISFLADTLKKMNKTFLLVFAPGKAAYFPEYIPEDRKAMKGITNIEVYSRLAKEMNIPHIDFHSWFIQQKDKSPYPLVPKYGIHWSQYGAIRAWDSVLTTIEKSRGIDIPDMYWDKIKMEKAKDTDIDIEKGMNLLFRFQPELMAYPEVLFEENEAKTKPSVLVVGDSYYWQIFGMGISTIFNRSDFWYYFKSAHSPRYDKTKNIEEVDIVDEINQHEVIILMSTDVHLPNLGWNFVETLFDYYHGKIIRAKIDPSYNEDIKRAMDNIKDNKEWLKQVAEKARTNNIPLDSMIYLDAKWTVDEQERQKKK
jgi:hypothetical protein